MIMVVIALTAFTANAQQQQQQEPSTFEKHDTVKVVLHTYADSLSLDEKKIRAFKVLEIRKGDQSGTLYAIAKKYLDASKKPLTIENLPVYQETVFAWKQEAINAPIPKKKE